MSAEDQNKPASDAGKPGNSPASAAESAAATSPADSVKAAAGTVEPAPATVMPSPEPAVALADSPASLAGEPVAAAAAEIVPKVVRPLADPMKPVRIWLWLLVAMVFAMVIVGGATRLTEAGLSITEWKPITGVIPPLSDAAWMETFNKYKQIPQYKEMFSTMTLAQYKVIFYWEWGHRLLGRLIGLVFIVPFLIFLFMRRINAALFWKLLGILTLGAIQGGIGWWMVKSGLSGRVEVAPERLAVHLLLASFTFVALIWVAMNLRTRATEPAASDVRGEATGLIVAILIQIGLGALVAGARAGLTYNTWPLMDGHFMPSIEKLTSMQPLWKNFLENPTTLQFQHRIFAYLLVLLVLGHAFKVMQSAAGARAIRRAWTLSVLVLVQAALGILTLLYVLPAGKMPIHLALTHQGVAFLLLAMAVVHRAAMAKPGATAGTAANGSEFQVEPVVLDRSNPGPAGKPDETAIAT